MRILRAQLWELWRLTWLDFVVRIGGTLAYLWLFTWMPEDVKDHLQGIVLIAVALASLVSSLWLTSYNRQGTGRFPLGLGYTRPIPTGWLVAIPLTWLCITNALVFLVLTWVAQMVFSWDVPQLALLPAILLTTALVAVVSWCTVGQAERKIAAAIVGVGALLFIRCVDVLNVRLSTSATGPNPMVYAIVAFAFFLVACLCIFAVGQLRSGGRQPLWGGQSLFQRPSQGPERVDAFRNARHAQWWFDLRRTGSRARAVVLTGLALMLITSWGTSEFGDQSVVAILWRATLVITPLALLGVTVDGVLGLKDQGTDAALAIYEAIRPVTIRQSIRQKLAMILTITLAGWAAIALGAFVIAAVFYGGFLREIDQFLSRRSDLLLLQTAGAIGGVCLLATAACIALALLLMSAGYVVPRLRDFPVACWCFAAAVAFSLAIPVVEGMSGWNASGLAHACQVLWGLFFIGVTVSSLWRAARKGFYSVPWLVTIACAWTLVLVALGSAAVYGGMELPPFTPYMEILMAGLLCIPLASVAWAPLSLAALRHQ